jgi:hypothetical protein
LKPQGEQPVAIFYPLGHPTPYVSEAASGLASVPAQAQTNQRHTNHSTAIQSSDLFEKFGTIIY